MYVSMYLCIYLSINLSIYIYTHTHTRTHAHTGTSNIVFSNGLLDPWAAGGVLHNISATVIALLLPSGAHHSDLMFSNAADGADVVAARSVHRAHMRQWIRAYDDRSRQKR